MTSARVFVPNWSRAVTHASRTAGTVAESGPVGGISPVFLAPEPGIASDDARLTKNSRVAFIGAWPIPSITTTFWPLSLIRIGASPPNEKCENSITEAAKIVATPASTALPPRWSMRSPASTDSGCPPATTPRLPRTTGLNVSACEVVKGKPARMKDVIRQKTIRLDFRMNIGGPPLSRLMRGIVPQRVSHKKAQKHKKRKSDDETLHLIKFLFRVCV